MIAIYGSKFSDPLTRRHEVDQKLTQKEKGPDMRVPSRVYVLNLPDGIRNSLVLVVLGVQ